MDTFIADLKDSVRAAKESPSGKGTMVAVYGTSLFIFFYVNCFSIFPFVFYKRMFRVTAATNFLKIMIILPSLFWCYKTRSRLYSPILYCFLLSSHCNLAHGNVNGRSLSIILIFAVFYLHSASKTIVINLPFFSFFRIGKLERSRA